MSKDLIAKTQVTVDAPTSRVWEALTDPALIKQYLFGTQTETSWKVGEPIFWHGEYQGKTYEDKGTVLVFDRNKRLETTYWSSMSGLDDTPENYKKVTYDLEADGDKTKLTLTQDNNTTEDDKNHSEANWKMVLEGLKKVVESNLD